MATKQSHNADVVTYVKDRILGIPKLLNVDECTTLINECEAKGFQPSPLSGGGHGRTGREGARTSQFLVRDDADFANKLWKRVKNYVPDNLRGIKPVPYMNLTNPETRGDEYTPVAVNEHLRFYKYDPGQYILKHDDYRMSRYRYDRENDQYYQQMTFFTLLVYLNQDFEGGQTCFWTKYSTPEQEGPSHCRFIREIEFAEADLKVSPATGNGLLQDHMVQHEGEPPKARGGLSGIKYILRTDILHEKPVAADRVNMKIKKGKVYSDWTRHYEPSCLHYTE